MKSCCLVLVACCFVACRASAADALVNELTGGAAETEAAVSAGPADARDAISPLERRNAMAAEEQQYLLLIEQREEAGGLTAPELVEPLTALGDLY
ncbi:MAG TPA: hypothetical protein VGE69_08870, partial [Pseudomonadales bacterium]